MKHLVVAVALIGCAIGSVADERRYQLKPEETNMFGFTYGSREGNAEYVLPFEKTYAQLTAAQQSRLKEAYVEMGELDEPPFPTTGLKAIYEPITQGQQRLAASGLFSADVEVSEAGDPISMAIYRSPNRTVRSSFPTS